MCSAVVVAIFVFAVGTAFVVAQVVPPARGTRATSTLGRGRMQYTVAPAPALILGSVLVVLIPYRWAGATSVAILLGAFLYLLVSLWAMMNILFDATDPRRFKKPLLCKARRATQARPIIGRRRGKRSILVLNPAVPALVDPSRGTWPQRGPKAAADDMHGVVQDMGMGEAVFAWWHKRVRGKEPLTSCMRLSVQCGDGEGSCPDKR